MSRRNRRSQRQATSRCVPGSSGFSTVRLGRVPSGATEHTQ
jgi:hypothetical protein